ncbi:MAG TPA: RsmD family RNA methyltransferase [Chloroflexota bacterium]|nr:RsmD family RNA methyltransferase [Chloroflexota bacterium]
MRVIAGTARGRPLTGPAGPRTRPTSDKVKGALFSILETLLAAERPGEAPASAEPGTPELWEGLTVVDLYAGTGALGIEALSRGAAWCDFVEANAAARRIIERNLRATGLDDRARVVGLDVEKVVRRTAHAALHAPYDLTLMDPPYDDLTVSAVIGDLARSALLVPRALVAVEHSRRLALSDEYDGLGVTRERRYGDTVLSIYRDTAANDSGVTTDGHDGDLSRHV